ncbi:uncharacterized protein LOC134764970 [Penaeus indicus]|uniref:uncharacterized protein LOC134764970 n=1 Tax=Penaeus indicus TaxID=29960 RepID=UPI00300C99C0
MSKSMNVNKTKDKSTLSAPGKDPAIGLNSVGTRTLLPCRAILDGQRLGPPPRPVSASSGWHEKIARGIMETTTMVKEVSGNQDCTRPGEDAVIQHRIVCTILNIRKEKKVKLETNRRIMIWKLKGDKVAEYREKVNEKNNGSTITVEENWKALKTAVMNSAAEVCGTTRGGKHQEKGTWWWNEQKIKQSWRDYFNNLLNVENERDPLERLPLAEGPVQEISLEVRDALNKMKSGKVTGVSGLPCETPCEIVTIYKRKGDPWEFGNYRGIKLLEQGIKVLEKIIEKRLRMLSIIDDMQFVFSKGNSKGKGTMDAASIIKQLQENPLEVDKDVYFTFADLESTYVILLHLDTFIDPCLHPQNFNYDILSFYETKLTTDMQHLINAPNCNIVFHSIMVYFKMLGPIHFLIYINDFVKTSSCLKFILYSSGNIRT